MMRMNDLSSEEEYLIIGDQEFMTRYVVDDGADRSFMSREMANCLMAANSSWTTVDMMDDSFFVDLAVDGQAILCKEYMMLTYVIHLRVGFIEVPLERVFILDFPMRYFLVGRPALISIGVDVPSLLQEIASRSVKPVSASARSIRAILDDHQVGDGLSADDMQGHETISYVDNGDVSAEDLLDEAYEDEVIGDASDEEFRAAIPRSLRRC